MEKQKPKPKKRRAKASDLKYPLFTMTRSFILAQPDLMANRVASNQPKYKLLIFKPEFDGQTGDIVNMKLQGFPTVSHHRHGQNPGPGDVFFVPVVASSFALLPRQVIWGNIYANWRSIRRQIYDNATQTLRTDFGFIILTPITHEPGQSALDGYLRYFVDFFKPNGDPMDGSAGGGRESTKPSPPAPPNP